MEALKAPELYAPALPSGFATLARLWHYEGAGAWTAWSLSSRPSAIDASPLRIRKLVWDRPGESSRYAPPPAPGKDGPTPRLTLSEGRFPVESWDALLQEARTLRVPPLLLETESPPGGARDCTGFAYHLATRTVSFEWWGEPPEEWKDLAAWSARVREMLDAWARR
ncbi:hypothetical protein [Hyalangium gracile]|uniref:hypothetical protein n=1 Tax=Hyalangium gracile TaxID=394092 RepID=UPI001CD034AB|nr:hypothetical protein [Hyalangium gracile]